MAFFTRQVLLPHVCEILTAAYACSSKPGFGSLLRYGAVLYDPVLRPIYLVRFLEAGEVAVSLTLHQVKQRTVSLQPLEFLEIIKISTLLDVSTRKQRSYPPRFRSSSKYDPCTRSTGNAPGHWHRLWYNFYRYVLRQGFSRVKTTNRHSQAWHMPHHRGLNALSTRSM